MTPPPAAPADRPAALCTAEIALAVRPTDVNARHSVFGGFVMDLVDRVATLAAGRFAGRSVVTASFDRLDFLAGIRAYQTIRLRAHGTRSFHSSMEVHVDVEGEDPVTGRRWPTSQAAVTVVALRDDGRPAPLPRLVPASDREREEWESAAERRELRLRALREPAPDYGARGPESAGHLAFEMSTEFVMPENVNELGLARAGWVLSVCDKLAFVSAARHCGLPAVTASVGALSFGRPIRVGEVAIFQTFLTRAFRTSMEVRAEIWRRSPYAGPPEHVSTCYSTFVAVDGDGRPAPVPPLQPRTPNERALYDAAGERRATWRRLGWGSGGQG